MTSATENWDEADAVLSASIFGTRHRHEAISSIRAWLAELGHEAAEIVSLELSVGAAVDIRLADGSNMFAKIWSAEADRSALAAQLHAQDAMALRGFPAPKLRSRLSPLGTGCAVLMDFIRSGEPTDVRVPGVLESMAHGLARLVEEASDLASTADFPTHTLPAVLWPKPHNVLFDFGPTTKGAEWIDVIADPAWRRLRASPLSPVVGHLDWSAKNMRMHDRTIAVVYDWDALFVADEPFVVGSAAATFPTTWELPVPPIPSAEQSAAFVAAYQMARGGSFNPQELDRVGLSLTYSHCYRARCDHAVDPVGAKRRWAPVLGKLDLEPDSRPYERR